MPLDQRDEIGGRVASQRGLGEVRVGGEEVLRRWQWMLVKLQRPPPEIRIFFPSALGALDNGDAATALARLDGAHQPGCATAENQCVK